MAVAGAGAGATTKAMIDSSNSNSSSKAITPFRRRRNLVAKKNYRGPTQPPETPDDHGGYGGYPRVNIKNKTKVAVSGMVTYDTQAFTCHSDLYQVNPGETWTAPTDRGACLVVCVLANPDVPTPLNIAKEYHSGGTSYAEFEIVYDVDEASYLVQRPGGNIPGPHLFTCDNTLDHNYILPTCTNRYHNPWPPTIPGDCQEDPLRTSHPTVQPTEAPPPTEKQPTEAPQTAKPTDPGTAGCPSGSNTPQPWNECKQWYMCNNGQASAIFDCPSGLLFNSDAGVCDYPYNVKCE